MHPDEAATIAAFIAPSSRARWLAKLASAQRRSFLDRLNHCPDLDERHAGPLPSCADVVAVLRSHGAPASCRVISDNVAIDGRELPLNRAVEEAESAGFGTIICCVPGRLAYFYDERGLRRFLLERHGTA